MANSTPKNNNHNKGGGFSTSPASQPSSSSIASHDNSRGYKSNLIHSAGREALGTARSALKNGDDAGAQTAGHVIDAGFAARSTFKSAQYITPGLINVGKGAWEVVDAAGRATVTVANTARLVQSGFIPMNRLALNILKAQAVSTGLADANLSRQIINRVQTINNRVQTIKTGASTAASAVKTNLLASYTVIRGVTTGTMYSSVSIAAIRQLQNAAASGIRTVGKGTLKSAVKGGAWAATKGVPKFTKFAGGTAFSVANMLSKSENTALQGLGGAVGLSRYSVKTAVDAGKLSYKSFRVLKTGVKKSARVAKGSWYLAKMVREQGWNAARNKASQAVVHAGRSAISAVIDGISSFIRTVGMKVVIPLLLIVCVILAGTNLITSPVTAISALFGGSFSSTEDGKNYKDHDIREYLENTSTGVPPLRANYINNLVSQLQEFLKSNGGEYDEVNFYSDSKDNKVDCSYDAINNVFYSESDVVNIIQPIYNAVLLMDYDLSPSESEAQNLSKEIFNSLFYVSYEPVIEERSAGFDKDNHPLTETYSTMNVMLTMDGIYGLLHKYFSDPIDKLSNLSSRTDEQEKKLQNLLSCYDLCLEYIREVNISYGGGMTMDDLSDVQWVRGSKPGCQPVVDLGLSQVGQAGGQPYWSSFGFKSRVEWCGCFVDWVEHTSGHGDAYGNSGNNAYIPTLATYWRTSKKWLNGGATDLAAGNIIFFDWIENGYQDGSPDHVGIVIGRDDKYVYTVEGNSGDTVKIRKYPLSSTVIYGYGIPSY